MPARAKTQFLRTGHVLAGEFQNSFSEKKKTLNTLRACISDGPISSVRRTAIGGAMAGARDAFRLLACTLGIYAAYLTQGDLQEEVSTRK